MTLTERIRQLTTTCERCGTTLKIGELPDHRRLETCHPSWHYRLPRQFQDPALADLASRPSPEKTDRADFPAGSDLSDGERTDHALEPADYRTVLSRLRGSSRGSTLRPSNFEDDA